jgi:adenylate cyclase
MTPAEAARAVGVAPATLRRWVKAGVLAKVGREGWTAASVAQARLVHRMRERGHSLEAIKEAMESGQLAYGYIEDVLAATTPRYTLDDAAADTGLEPALIERIITALGFPQATLQQLSEEDLQLLRYSARVLKAGFPLIAFLQLVRVYGLALAQIADAEVRLFHLYVHEPMMRDGVPGMEMAEEMSALSGELLPYASPIMDHIHQRFLAHFIEQDVIGHMEADLDNAPMDLGRLRVAIAFADLAGYTRLTEEEGDEEAVEAVERFVEAVELTLPENARIIKTIGDEVMVVGSDAAELTDWAVGFQQLYDLRPLPRIGIHYGETLYRDGDYYGREVNQAARVAARAAGGEVLVTRPVAEAAAAPHLDFNRIGEVRLKGFSEATELFLARAKGA